MTATSVPRSRRHSKRFRRAHGTPRHLQVRGRIDRSRDDTSGPCRPGTSPARRNGEVRGKSTAQRSTHGTTPGDGRSRWGRGWLAGLSTAQRSTRAASWRCRWLWADVCWLVDRSAVNKGEPRTRLWRRSVSAIWRPFSGRRARARGNDVGARRVLRAVSTAERSTLTGPRWTTVTADGVRDVASIQWSTCAGPWGRCWRWPGICWLVDRSVVDKRRARAGDDAEP